MANTDRRVIGQRASLAFQVTDTFTADDPVSELRMVPVVFPANKPLRTSELRVYLAWDFGAGDGIEINWTLRGRNDGISNPDASGWTDQVPVAIYGDGLPETGTQAAPESAVVIQDAATVRGMLCLVYRDPPHIWEITGVQTDDLDTDSGPIERSYVLTDVGS